MKLLSKSLCRLLAASFLALGVRGEAAAPPADPAPALTGPSFLANGDFASAKEDPAWADGWIKGKDGRITRETAEDGGHFIRLVSEKPDQLVQVWRLQPIPEGVAGLEFAARFRTANVKFGASFMCDARTSLYFLDAEGRPVKGSGGGGVFDSHAKAWTILRRTMLVPPGAKVVKVLLQLNKPSSGTLDIAEVLLAPQSEGDAEARAQGMLEGMLNQAEDEVSVAHLLSLPPRTQEVRVVGNRLLTAKGEAVRLRGVNVESLEWWPKGENVLRTAKVALVDWKANAIRLPVTDRFWFGLGKPPATSNDPEAYKAIIDGVVKMAAGQGAYVILDLHRYMAPDETSVAFWKEAAARYANNPAVLFDLFNEPHSTTWEVWRNGGQVTEKAKAGAEPRVYQSPGMQGLLETVRNTGARNVVVAGGLSFAYDLTGILNGFALDDKAGNGVMYAVHFYNWHRGWESHFLGLADKYPILVGEFGADVKKMPFVPAAKQEDPYTWVPDALGMVEKYQLNWTAFSLHPKSTPVLISDWDYTPTPFWGLFVKEALAGKTFEMKQLR